MVFERGCEETGSEEPLANEHSTNNLDFPQCPKFAHKLISKVFTEAKPEGRLRYCRGFADMCLLAM